MSDTAILRDTRNYNEATRPRFGRSNVVRPQDQYGDRPPPQGLSAEENETYQDVLMEARDRHRRVLDWEGDFRARFTEDVRFVNGDSDNHWQWPDTLFGDRQMQQRPALTVNKTRQHCLQLINDAKQNKPQIRVSPVSDDATKASADVFEGVIRHIEYASNAQVAYDTATTTQVHGGIGWWRVLTERDPDNPFLKVIRLKRIADALSVWMDPDIDEVDGSDAKFAFVVDDVPRTQFAKKYPQWADRIPQGTWAGSPISGGWLDKDMVRVAEYFRVVEDPDVAHLLPDNSVIHESEVENETTMEDVRRLSLDRRNVFTSYVEWFKIVGGEIVDEATWPGKYIPLVRVVGEEAIIQGRLERKGHVRALKDPQRIYNYWSSSAVESVALQSKTPWTAAAESIEGFQQYWDTANTQNHSVLPYNARDDQGNPLPEPRRAEPPQMPQAYIAGLQIAQSEMSMVTGQYQPNMGQPSPYEISGKAIQARQRQGDTAGYHFVDNLAIAIRFTGRILIDLIPKIYDSRRIMRILAPDGTVDRVLLDPTIPQALQQRPNPAQAEAAGGLTPPTPQQALATSVTRVFNPGVGTYEVQADVGPAYATKRQEAFNAFTQIVQTAPQIMQIAGDLLFKAADFPMAEELAERLQRLVPPQALGTGPSPAEQSLTVQLQGVQAHVALLSEQLAVANMKLKGRDEQKDIDAYDAVTKRMGTLLSMRDTDSMYVDGQEVRGLIMQMVQDALKQSGMAPVSNASMLDMQRINNAMTSPGPPEPGTPQAPGMTAPPNTPRTIPGLNSGALAALSPTPPPGVRPLR